MYYTSYNKAASYKTDHNYNKSHKKARKSVFHW